MSNLIIWVTEKSYKVRAPDHFGSTTLEHLRHQLQQLADTYIPDPEHDIPPLGQLDYRYELNGNDEVTAVHAYFLNRNNSRSRFIRLRRDS